MSCETFGYPLRNEKYNTCVFQNGKCKEVVYLVSSVNHFTLRSRIYSHIWIKLANAQQASCFVNIKWSFKSRHWEIRACRCCSMSMDHSEWVCPWVVMWPTAMAAATISVENVIHSEAFRWNILQVSVKPF